MPECNMPFAELCVCMVVVCGIGCLCKGIFDENAPEDACCKRVCRP